MELRASTVAAFLAIAGFSACSTMMVPYVRVETVPAAEKQAIDGTWRIVSNNVTVDIRVDRGRAFFTVDLPRASRGMVAFKDITRTGPLHYSCTAGTIYGIYIPCEIMLASPNRFILRMPPYPRPLLQEGSSETYSLLSADNESALLAEFAPKAVPNQDISAEAIKAAVQDALHASQAPRTMASAAPALVSDVDKPGYSNPENPDYYALVIGIQRYSDLPEAQFADRDSQAVVDHLIASGYPRRNVIHLTGDKAGRAGIEKYVEKWLPKNLDDNSRLFFYFSGHGAPDMVTGEAFLVPYDGDANFLETTGYPIKRLYQMLGKLRSKEVIVAIDSCFSGAGGRSVLAKGARPLVAKVETITPTDGKIVAFSASANNEISGSLEDQGHGAFTYFFLKGLSGAAKDPSGRVTVKSLYDYLRPKVQDAARRLNRDQTPQLSPATAPEQAQLILR